MEMAPPPPCDPPPDEEDPLPEEDPPLEEDGAVMVVCVLAELFPVTVSVAVVVTAAVDVAVPAVAAVALMVTVTDFAGARSSRLQVISAAAAVHVPTPVLTVPGVRPLPSWYVSCVEVAVLGPAFATVTV